MRDTCIIDLGRTPFLREMLLAGMETRLSGVEMAIVSRLAVKGDRSAYDVANGAAPALEEMDAWFAMLRLERDHIIYRGVVSDHLWRLTGCGRIAAVVTVETGKP